MKRIAIFTAIPVMIAGFFGCTLDPITPVAGYYVYPYGETDNYVIQIIDETSGEFYDWPDGAGSPSSTNTFTITVDFPWHFLGGPLDHDASGMNGKIIVNDFNGEEYATFASCGKSYP